MNDAKIVKARKILTQKIELRDVFFAERYILPIKWDDFAINRWQKILDPNDKYTGRKKIAIVTKIVSAGQKSNFL